MTKKKTGSDPICSMPYDMRLREYEREKQEMFQRMVGVPAVEIMKEHHKLVEKWRV